MTLTARFLLPKIPREEVSKNDESKARLFFCSFKLAPKSPLVGVTLGNSGLMVTRDLRLVAIQNKDSFIAADKDRCLMEGDVYVVEAASGVGAGRGARAPLPPTVRLRRLVWVLRSCARQPDFPRLARGHRADAS